MRLPESGVQHVRVVRIHDEIHDTGGVVPEQNALPGGPTIPGAIHPARRMRPEDVAEDADIDEIGVRRVHDDIANVFAVGESFQRPRAAAIRRLPHPIPMRDVAANRIFTAADVHDVRIGGSDADRADGASEIAVRYREPRLPTVSRLEDAAAGRSMVVLVRSRDASRDSDGPTAAVRTELSPAKSGKGETIELLCEQVAGKSENNERSDADDAGHG